MPTVAMLIGVPLSGKSTSLQLNPWSSFVEPEDKAERIVIASSDTFIERIAQILDMKYGNIFHYVIKPATEAMNNKINEAIDHNYSVIWDQTNLDPGTRRNKLKRIPKHYKKIAVYYHPPSIEEFELRNLKRFNATGKDIPLHVFTDMRRRLEKPTLSEGFDRIIEMNGSKFC